MRKMGIYIPKLKMSDDCRECYFQKFHDDIGWTVCHVEGKVLAENRKPIPWNGIPDWCPIQEIEKHGDLVDRSYLLSEYDRQHVGKPGGARKIMETAPTIIQGSE